MKFGYCDKEKSWLSDKNQKSQTTKIKTYQVFSKVVNGSPPFSIFAKSSILDV